MPGFKVINDNIEILSLLTPNTVILPQALGTAVVLPSSHNLPPQFLVAYFSRVL